MSEMTENKSKNNFKYNKPSIIDLYSRDFVSFENIVSNIVDSKYSKQITYKMLDEKILKVTFKYKENSFNIYLTIVDNVSDITKINKVLTESSLIQEANNCKKYIKSYIDAKQNFVQAYYAQIKLLYIITNDPILIVDCSQWCIYSSLYLKQFYNTNVDIIDSNLFKVKLSEDNCLYTEGLERFGIKDIQMINVEEQYQKTCGAFLSRLARYFIENGQVSNSCMEYKEVFESSFYACLIDIEQVIETLKTNNLVSKKRDNTLDSNKVFVSIHCTDNVDQWYLNDEEVLKYLSNNKTYYSSQKHFDDEKLLAQESIVNTIEYLSRIDDEKNLMILARNEEISTDWYYYDGIDNNKIVLKNSIETLKIEIKDVINWNYRGVTPLYAYSLVN